jgi:hypothetical protein
MTLTITCSLMVNGPGLSETPKILPLGTMRAQRRMMGNESSSGTSWPIVTDGNRKLRDGKLNVA